MSSKAINIKDFKTEIGGKLSDPYTYEFKEIVSTGAHSVKMFYNIVVRLCYESTDKTEDANGDHPADKFITIDDSYFDSNTKLPEGAVGWIKVLSKTGVQGKIKKSPPTYVREGKNIGKKNQTNAFTQALRDALSKYNKQLAKSSEDSVEYNGVKLYPPMLAQLATVNEQLFTDNQCLFIQKKLNGVRAVATLDSNNDVVMYSRTRKIYPGFDYIKEELRKCLSYFVTEYNKRVYLDGEIYKHGESLQLISGTARRELLESKKTAIELEYHVYDMFVPSEPQLTMQERFDLLDTMFDAFTPKYIKYLGFDKICDKSELSVYYGMALRDKYEGVMLRLNVPYEYSYNGYHSKNLLKVKPVNDGEYQIVGYSAGIKGKSEGVLLFELAVPCATNADCPVKTFTINIGMPIEQRKELFEKMSVVEANGKTHFDNNYKNKYLTVLYDELSTDGVPVRARTEGIIIRDYE